MRFSLMALPVVVLSLMASYAATSTAAASVTQPRALVLEPFSSQYKVENGGQYEVKVLSDAGFVVTVLRDSAVTVDVMRQLWRYAFVYIFTHAGPLPNNDAAVATGDTRHHRFARYFANYSLAEMHIIADGRYRYFDAITGRFIRRYDGAFAAHTVVFINACTALGMPRFWRELHESGVSTLVSWRHHVAAADAAQAAQDVFASLAEGKTVSEAIRISQVRGVGMSTVDRKFGWLSFEGDGTSKLFEQGAVVLHPSPLPIPRCDVDCQPPTTVKAWSSGESPLRKY